MAGREPGEPGPMAGRDEPTDGGILDAGGARIARAPRQEAFDEEPPPNEVEVPRDLPDALPPGVANGNGVTDDLPPSAEDTVAPRSGDEPGPEGHRAVYPPEDEADTTDQDAGPLEIGDGGMPPGEIDADLEPTVPPDAGPVLDGMPIGPGEVLDALPPAVPFPEEE